MAPGSDARAPAARESAAARETAAVKHFGLPAEDAEEVAVVMAPHAAPDDGPTYNARPDCLSVLARNLVSSVLI